MSDYTPTTEQVRVDYVMAYTDRESSQLLAERAFDRWLAARDAEVAAKALREAQVLIKAHISHSESSSTASPYQQALSDAWGMIANRIQEIEREGGDVTINEALDLVGESAEDVPDLLAEIKRLREGIEALHGAVQEFGPCPDGPWGCDELTCTESVHSGEWYHDAQPTGRVCLTCRYEDGEPHDWPCETADLLNLVNYHTCGAGPGSGAGHEPGCGTIPVGRLAAPEHDAAVYVRELRADADAAEAAGVIDAAIRDYHTARARLLDVILDACPRHLPLDQEDGRRHWCKRCGRTTFGELIGEVGK